MLRTRSPGEAAQLPVCGYLRDYHFARSVMEVKRHLLRCLRNMQPAASATPDIILIDAGLRNADIKTELERWIEKHHRLRRIKVMLPRPRPWVVRLWARAARFIKRGFEFYPAFVTRPV
jgi:hypothetical protein